MPLLDRLMGRGTHQQGHHDEVVVDGDAADCPVCNPTIQQEPKRGKHHDSQFMQSGRTGYQGSEPVNVQRYEVPVSTEQQGVVRDVQHQELKRQQVGSEPVQVFDDAQTRNGVNLPEAQNFERGPVLEEVGMRQQNNVSSETGVTQMEQPRSPKKQGIASKVKKLFQPEHERRQERYTEGEGVGTQNPGTAAARASRQDAGTMTSKTTDNIAEAPTQVSAPDHSASAGGLSPRGDWTPVEGFSFRHSTTPPPHLSRREEKAANAVEKHDQGYSTSVYDSAQDNNLVAQNSGQYDTADYITYDVPHSRPGRYASGDQGGAWGDHRASEVGSFRGAGMHSPSRKRPTSERPYWTAPGNENDPSVAAAVAAGGNATSGRDRNVRAREEARRSGSSSPDSASGVTSARTRASGSRSRNSHQDVNHENGACDLNRSRDSQPGARDFDSMLAPQGFDTVRPEGEVYDPWEDNRFRQSRKHHAGAEVGTQGYNSQPLENFADSQNRSGPGSSVSRGIDQPKTNQSSVNNQDMSGAALGANTRAQPANDIRDYYHSDTSQPNKLERAAFGSGQEIGYDDDVQRMKGMRLDDQNVGAQRGYDNQNFDRPTHEQRNVQNAGYDNQASERPVQDKRSVQNAGYDNQVFDMPQHESYRPTFENERGALQSGNLTKPQSEVDNQNRLGVKTSNQDNFNGFGTANRNDMSGDLTRTDNQEQDFNRGRFQDSNAQNRMASRNQNSSMQGYDELRGRSEQGLGDGGVAAARNQYGLGERGRKNGSFNGNTGRTGLETGAVGTGLGAVAADVDNSHAGIPHEYARAMRQGSNAQNQNFDTSGYQGSNNESNQDFNGDLTNNRRESNYNNQDVNNMNSNNQDLTNRQEPYLNNQGFNGTDMNTGNQDFNNMGSSQDSGVQDYERSGSRSNQGWGNEGVRDQQYGLGEQGRKQSVSDGGANRTGLEAGTLGAGALGMGAAAAEAGRMHAGIRQDSGRIRTMGSGEPRLNREDEIALGQGKAAETPAAASAASEHAQTEQSDLDNRYVKESPPTNSQGPTLAGMGSQSCARAHAQTEQSDLDNRYVKEGAPMSAQEPAIAENMDMGAQESPRAQQQYQYIQHGEPVRSGGLLSTAKYAFGRAQNKLTNTHHHLTAGGTNISSVTGVAFGKLDVVAKRMLRGGDHLWREAFHPPAEEHLRKSFACLLSTENGAVAGSLYLSDHNLWFCSDRALQRAVKSETEPSSPPAIQQYLYKVVLPLADVGSINSRTSERSERDKSIKVEMTGGEEFWFFGFVNFEKALLNLEHAGDYHKFRSASMKAGGA